jgi:hypothetical protein
MAVDLRNYLYISDAKVDSYLGQWSETERSRWALSVGINVGVLNVSGQRAQPTVVDRIHRLNAVEKYLRQTKDIRGLYDETSWFEGTMFAAPVRLEGRDDALFLLGDDENGFVALTGSAAHIVGGGGLPTTTTAAIFSHTFGLVDTLRFYQDDTEVTDEGLAFGLHVGVSKRPDGIHVLIPVLSTLRQQIDNAARIELSFLARRLVPNTYYGDTTYVAGSPLYVSVSDVYGSA